jgi:uncharacterized UPF0160 family protein
LKIVKSETVKEFDKIELDDIDEADKLVVNIDEADIDEADKLFKVDKLLTFNELVFKLLDKIELDVKFVVFKFVVFKLFDKIEFVVISPV